MVDGRVEGGKEEGAIKKARERKTTQEEKRTPTLPPKAAKDEEDGPRGKNLGLDQAEIERKLERELGL